MEPHTFLRQALLAVHFIGLAFGFGGATVADFSFIRSLKKGDRVTPETVSWMRSFSKIVWAGIGLLTLSGLGLFLMNTNKYLHSPGFLAKMVVVTVLIINGFFLNFYVTARLTTFNFSEKYIRSDAAWRVRKLSMIFGAVSAVSWYSALIIAEFKDSLSTPFDRYMALYFLALVTAITASLGMEAKLNRRSFKSINQPQQPTIDQLAYSPRPAPVNPQPTVNQANPLPAGAHPTPVINQAPTGPENSN